MTTTLTFPIADVLANARHALDAPGHKPTFIEREEGRTPGPRLWWVKDDGTYLMSNGEGDRPPVAYAEGYEPGTPDLWDRTRDACGGDDFVEPLIDLTGSFGQELVAAGPNARLVLKVHETSATIELTEEP